MSPRELQGYRRSLEVGEYMRRGLSLTAASRKVGINLVVARAWIAPALFREGRRWRIRPTDRLLRLMVVLGEGGVEHGVFVRSSRVASLVGEHWSAIGHYLDTSDESRLVPLSSKRVAGIELLTDPSEIEMWDRRGELNVEDVYAFTA
ncbi:MAG: hypothetical protein ACKVUT_03595 [Gaiella sp.]